MSSQVATFEADPASGAAARRFVADFLREHERDVVVDDATLCVSELVSNAVLHTRRPFEVAVRTAGAGARIDVIDGRPGELPSPIPLVGSATDLTDESTTGRGLAIIAALATRWGISTSPSAKFVWVELGAKPSVEPTEPVLNLGHHIRHAATDARFRLENLPVRAAVASGVQVDELVREIQLGGLASAPKKEVALLYALLDASAGVRLAGRHAALRAAATGDLRFDLEFTAALDGIAAVAELSQMLTALPAGLSGSDAAPSAPVLEFRGWLQQEVAAQISGATPTPCPLPA